MLYCCLPIFFNDFIQKYHQSLDPVQARHFVGPGLGLNCLQMLNILSGSQLRLEKTCLISYILL